MQLRELDDRIIIAGAWTADDLPAVIDAGVRTVIDLRAHGEPRPQGLPPWEEAAILQRAGIAYRQEPVEPPLLHDDLGHAMRRAVAHAEPRVLLHCTTGRRAVVFGLFVLACERALTIDECRRRGQALGFDFEGMPRLDAFLCRYVARHGRRGRDVAMSDYQV